MKKTSREIINQAQKLSGSQNSKAFDFAFKVSLLNSVYTQLYNELAGISNSFVGYFTFTDKESALPDDCYKVLNVFYGTIDNPFNISPSSINNTIPGSYYIENDTIRIVDKKDSKQVTVKYSKMPLVLTSPEDTIYFDVEDIDDNQPTLVYENKFYYTKTDGTIHAFDILNDSDEEVEEYPISFQQRFILSGTTVIDLDNNDVTEYFEASSPFTGNTIYPKEIISDYYGTNTIIRYSDNSIWYMDNSYNKVYLNHYEYKGQYFSSSKIYAVNGDAETGYGFVYYDDYKKKHGFASFVPDTVLDYPNSAFFDVLEDMLGIQFQSLTGMSYEGLATKLENDKDAFVASIVRNSQGNRIKNEDMRFGRTIW